MQEFDLLQHVYRANAALPRQVTIPPGDDMGAVRFGKQEVLITVDQVADGVHVDSSTMPLEKIGRKAITRNLSDVAAMAALPVCAVAAASLPRHWQREQAIALFDAMRETAAAYDCPLIGGDVSMWDQPMLVSVTVLADMGDVAPVLRKGARVGDAIYVTGELGFSFASGHHLDFEPRIKLARQLAMDQVTRPHCMIDLSDGLARDLQHLCNAGGVDAVVDASALPIPQRPATLEAKHDDSLPDWRHAVGDGEDYELLFTALPDAMPAQLAGVPITCIGSIVPRAAKNAGIVLRWNDGSTTDLANLGWEHHA